MTPFSEVYDVFFSKITTDEYMEFSEEETYSMVRELLLCAIEKFEFPRTPLDYKEDNFINDINHEEKNVLATYMLVEWMNRQLATIELVRMKYSGADFKFTSQANHIAKVKVLRDTYEQEGKHLQRLYKRRFKDVNGVYHSTFGKIMEPVAELPREVRP